MARVLGLLALVAGCAAQRARPAAELDEPTATPEMGSPERSADDQARMVGYFPDTPLLTQDGREVRFYSDLVREKRVLINFMYTSCSEA